MIMRTLQGAGLWGIAGLAVFGHGVVGKRSRGTDDKFRAGREENVNVIESPRVARAIAITSDVVSPSATASPVIFETDWEPVQQAGYKINTPFNLQYSVPKTPDSRISEQGTLSLALLWTSAVQGSPDASNTYEVLGVDYDCLQKSDTDITCRYDEGANGTAHLNLGANTAVSPPFSTGTVVENFFLCFATGVNPVQHALTCESYSDFFSVDFSPAARARRLRPRQGGPIVPVSGPQIPSSTLAVTLNTAFVTAVGTASPTTAAPSTTVPAGGVLITSTGISTTQIIFSMLPTGTTTVPPSSPTATGSGTALSTTSESKSSSFGTGPIVGVAIGGAAVLLIIGLILFLLRRRRQRKRSQGAEHVLLTENLSRDLVSEKSNMSPAGPSGPMLPSILESRPLSGTYDPLTSSTPYNGPAGKRTTLQPAQQQQQQQQQQQHLHQTALTRGMSDASMGGPISPRSTNLSHYGDGDEEPYHDNPIYGDARRAPQVYQSGPQAPFLSEPGMTDEELSRLEEEERRIDAAIAEAERNR